MKKKIGMITGLLFSGIILVLPEPEGLTPAAWNTLAIAALMGIWWVSETLPTYIVALIPILCFPLLGISTVKEATSPFAEPVIYLFMGGFIMAEAMQRWDLHKRIALQIISRVGDNPRSVLLGFMISTAFLSMWVSNTATVMMMIPIAASLIALNKEQNQSQNVSEQSQRNFLLALFLGVAYSGSIGGLATLIGTPPNALLAGFLRNNYGITIGFFQWMKFGIPLTLVSLPICYLLLSKWLFPISKDICFGSVDSIQNELKGLGKMSKAEKRVGIIILFTAFAWIMRPYLSHYVSGLSDAGIAMGCALLLFAIPSANKEQERLLSWEDCHNLPWGILILFGGGLSLARAIIDTGLAEWIAQRSEVLSSMPLVLMVAIVTLAIVFLTEVSSNTATAATFIPLLYAVGLGLNIDPYLLVIPATIATSCAFMLPVATPPNAIAYATGKIEISDMIRAGVWLNIIMVGIIMLFSFWLAPLVF